MSNFGFARLRVVNPYQLAFREARSAVGASAVLAHAEEYKSLAEAVSDCALVIGTTGAAGRQWQQPLKPLDEGAQIILQQLVSGCVALLFGSEKIGLSNAELSHCHWLLRIPTRPGHPSMNLGQAVAVCLYELVRDATTPRLNQGSKRTASAGELERITAVLLEVLRASGYVKPHTALPAEKKVRCLVRRLTLSVADAEIWLGMLRQILWKLRSPR